MSGVLVGDGMFDSLVAQYKTINTELLNLPARSSRHPVNLLLVEGHLKLVSESSTGLLQRLHGGADKDLGPFSLAWITFL